VVGSGGVYSVTSVRPSMRVVNCAPYLQQIDVCKLVRKNICPFWALATNRYWTTHQTNPALLVVRPHYVSHGDIVYQQVCKLGCEGIVCKRLGSPYRSAAPSIGSRYYGADGRRGVVALTLGALSNDTNGAPHVATF
jgi:hypothetical protein